MGINDLVFLGGSMGAVCRYAISIQVKRINSYAFPFATLLINLLGSFLLGVLLACDTGSLMQLFLGTGFVGGFTTFSTFQVENITLFRKGKYGTLFVYVTFSVALCIGAAFAGFRMAG